MLTLKDNKFADFICLSRCCSGKDIELARKIVGNEVQIIAKISTIDGINNFEEIIDKADGEILIHSALGT